ncbi:MAG: DNA replication and repair protein RecF, partial [Patescibacteria group bacterium]
MFLKQLNLTNFRNYLHLELNFDDRPTILVGNNASGKSNLLEAIYLLSTTKSLRAETEDELIKKDSEFAKVEGFVENGGETELLVIINRQTNDVKFRKKVLVNGIARRTIDFIGNLPAVIFYPADINLVTGPPSLRRWHLDLSLAQIDAGYKKALTLYEQFLTARNRVLKKIREGQGKSNELDYWTGELVDKGKAVSVKRKAFFDFINELETSLGEYRFEYKQSEISCERLAETNGREVAAAATLIGPHRDDFDIVTLGRNLAHFGSRGEQRTGTLAFKLAQLEYMAKILDKRPILLLDDVFSELDASHRAHVVEIVSKQQTIIATVEL